MVMLPQRARVAESRVELQIIKWITEGTEQRYARRTNDRQTGNRVFCDVWHTLVARDMLVSYKERITSGIITNGYETRWYRGLYSSLTDYYSCSVGDIFLPKFGLY